MREPAHILVVDDERGMRDGCRKILSPEGLFVETAQNGEEGLVVLRQGKCDLLLADLKMPGMGGIELIEAAKSIDPDLVCVVITGFATLETAVEATKRGAYDYLSKPFAPDELLAVVAKALEKRRLSLEAKRLRDERDKRLLEIGTQQSRLRTVINCMLDGVLVMNWERKLVLHNPAALRLLSLGGKNLIGRPIEECLDNKELVELIKSSVEPGEGEYSMLSRELTIDPNETVLMVNVAAVRDDTFKTLGSVAVLRDITQFKELDKMKSQFISMVAHELKAPLAAIKGYLDVMAGGMAGDLNEQQLHMVQRSSERAEALLGLIKDLLEVSRLEMRTVTRHVEPLQIGAIIAETVELLQGPATGKNITVRQETPASLPTINGDKLELSRVFTNLLSNAIKYNRQNGSVSIRAAVQESWLRVDVEDNGLGIPKDALPKLFREFYRVKTAETREITGTGLGLSIVKRIIEAHSGRVEVHSEESAGSTFSVYLPLEAGNNREYPLSSSPPFA